MKINKIFLAFAVFGFFAVAATALAVDYEPLVKIPGLTVKPGTMLTSYLSGLYNFLISIVGILAMAVIIYGGMRYLTSAGNTASMEDAKETIWSAVYGLALALGSWLIINVVNPDILVLKNPGVEGPKERYGYDKSDNNCIGNPTGTGTTTNPCICIDSAQVVSNMVGGSTPTKLTLIVTPATIGNALATTVTLSGKLTDASGTPLNNMTIKINRIAPILRASNTYTTTTNPSGDYTLPMSFAAGGPGTGVGGDTIQAVFDGIVAPAPGYAAIGSNTVIFTRNGIGVYASSDYQEPMGPSNVATIWNAGNICQTTCSDASKQTSVVAPYIIGYHCVGAKIVTNKPLNPDGVSTVIKKNEQITIDGVTNSIFPDDTTKRDSGFQWNIVGPHNYSDSTKRQLNLHKDVAGYPFTDVGTYNVYLRISPPATAPGLPQPVKQNPNFWIEVVP